MQQTIEQRYFGLALLAGGCAAKDVDVRTQGDSTPVRGRGQVSTESQPKSSKGKSSGQTGSGVSGVVAVVSVVVAAEVVA
jgi:hypothetical protein